MWLFAIMNSFDVIIQSLFQKSTVKKLESAKLAMSDKGDCSFNHIISVLVGCVSPKSFNDLYKEEQRAVTESVIKRLVYKTAFEVEGWKRIPAVRRIFLKAGLKVAIYMYNTYKVIYLFFKTPLKPSEIRFENAQGLINKEIDFSSTFFSFIGPFKYA